MYKWLEKELSEIKWRKFHVIHNDVVARIPSEPAEISSSWPLSYIAFVSTFGTAKLYRNLTRNSYQVGVIYPPQEEIFKDGEKLLYIGHFVDSKAYIIPSMVDVNNESPVYELTEEGFEYIADSFKKWLRKRCKDARKSYSKEEWKEIVNGPAPFTPKEEAIIEARRQFSWRVIGFDGDGDAIFEVKNNSQLVLPYLSVGVRTKDNTLVGAARLDVFGIKPGQEGVVKRELYKKLIKPDNTEVYSLPDPLPEDRERYWEFTELSSS